MFHDTRESVCVRAVPMFRGVAEAARAFPNGMGTQVRAERFKAAKVCWCHGLPSLCVRCKDAALVYIPTIARALEPDT